MSHRVPGGPVLSNGAMEPPLALQPLGEEDQSWSISISGYKEKFGVFTPLAVHVACHGHT